MLKEALTYLVSLKDNKTYEIHGDTYSDRELHRIAPHVDRPDTVRLNGLDSVAQMVRHELDMFENKPMFVRIVDHRRIEVLTALDSTMGRDKPYVAECDAAEFRPGWFTQDEAIIKLRSEFADTEDVAYLLDLCSRVSREDGVTSDDNGVSQTVSALQGVALKSVVGVKSRVILAPFRTFSEVEQPASEFILRLDDDLRIGLIEADGGAWKLEAKNNIRKFFALALEDELDAGSVVLIS